MHRKHDDGNITNKFQPILSLIQSHIFTHEMHCFNQLNYYFLSAHITYLSAYKYAYFPFSTTHTVSHLMSP